LSQVPSNSETAPRIVKLAPHCVTSAFAEAFHAGVGGVTKSQVLDPVGASIAAQIANDGRRHGRAEDTRSESIATWMTNIHPTMRSGRTPVVT
jgi:hypothetical protein